MTSSSYQATPEELHLLLGIIEKLNRCIDSRPLRQLVADDLLRLIKADILASFVWNEQLQQFEDAAYVNMSESNLQRYQQHYQHCDPITPLLALRKNTTLVEQVLPQCELEKTEFFNDFLKVDGLKYGINLHAYDGNMNIGDLRIWRGVRGEPFSIREVALMEMLKPHFTNAMINTRTLSSLRQRVSGWHDLWEQHPHPCLVFNSLGRQIHQNAAFRHMQTRMQTNDLQSLRMKMIKLAQGNTSACYWGEFRLSVLQGTEQETTDQMLYMVQITEKAKLIIDHEFILTHFDLSPAEANICLWLMRGLSDQAIAEHTCRSIWTIRAQVKSILSKLRVGSRSEITHLITSTVTEIHPPRSSKTHEVPTTSPLLHYLEKTTCQ